MYVCVDKETKSETAARRVIELFWVHQPGWLNYLQLYCPLEEN